MAISTKLATDKSPQTKNAEEPRDRQRAALVRRHNSESSK